MHNYDAQLASGVPQPLPVEVAVDGVEEFCITSGTTSVAWPCEDAFIDFHATEGPSWRTTLNAAGSSVSRLSASDTVPDADAFLQGSASDLVLAMYGRIPVDTLEIGGDPKVLDRLLNWDF